jgi:hypothetical protein
MQSGSGYFRSFAVNYQLLTPGIPRKSGTGDGFGERENGKAPALAVFAVN